MADAVTLGNSLHRVGSISLGQIHLLVLCKASLRPFVSAVETDSEAMGVGGVGKNKGCTALALTVCSHRLCFVNCHLAAHQGKIKQRHDNLADVEAKLKLGRASAGGQSLDLSQRFSSLFLLGDLNYRIDLPRDEVLRLIRLADWGALQRADQLSIARRAGDACAGFAEGALAFAPTFKHVPGHGPLVAPLHQPQEEEVLSDPHTEVGKPGDGKQKQKGVGLGLRPYEASKMRVPSWCDRILWTSLPAHASKVVQQLYRSEPEVATSDHSPVSAHFELELRVPCMERGMVLGCISLVLSGLCAPCMLKVSSWWCHSSPLLWPPGAGLCSLGSLGRLHEGWLVLLAALRTRDGRRLQSELEVRP